MSEYHHNAAMEAANHDAPREVRSGDCLVQVDEAPNFPGIIGLSVLPEALWMEKQADPVQDYAFAAMDTQEEGYLLSGLYVPAYMRRKGIAKALVWMAMEIAEKRGARLYLDVRPFADRVMPADALRAFYGRMGFAPFPGHPFSMVYQPSSWEDAR